MFEDVPEPTEADLRAIEIDEDDLWGDEEEDWDEWSEEWD